MARDGRIAGFDGLRAIAFLLVFASHKLPLPHRDTYGDTGVYTFFVLSGFLITGILARARAEVEAAGRTGVRRALARFYVRRAARIFPAYYGLLAVIFAISLVMPVADFWGGAKLAYLTYTTNMFIGARGFWPGDFGPLWSLAVEEQFYLLFAPLALLTPRARTAWLCLAFVGLAIATKVALTAAGASTTVIEVHSLVNFGLLGVGGLAGLAASRPAPPWLSSGLAQLATAVCLLAVPAMLGEPAEAYVTYGKAANLIAGLLLFQIAKGQGTALVAVLESAPLRALGRISYGAYLIHHFIHFQTLQDLLLGPAAAAVPQPVQVAAELLVTVALAAASWTLLERPILAWAHRLTGREPFVPAAAPELSRATL
jgi:peptidoglycan/LPS O-acetylase OafA/YrhL